MIGADRWDSEGLPIFGQGFEEFADLVATTWPGVTVQSPKVEVTEDGVVTITLNRPRARNALDSAMRYSPPGFVGPEVTGEEEYSGLALARQYQ